jgi:hypothetical protein
MPGQRPGEQGDRRLPGRYSNGPSSCARRQVTRQPIVAIKSKPPAPARRLSHTRPWPVGKLTTRPSAGGIMRAGSVQDLFDYASAAQPIRRDAIAVVTNAGGLGIMASDAIERPACAWPRSPPSQQSCAPPRPRHSGQPDRCAGRRPRRPLPQPSRSPSATGTWACCWSC